MEPKASSRNAEAERAGTARQAAPVLEQDGVLPLVARHPAPWTLRASGYLVAVHVPGEVIDRAAFMPAQLLGKRRGRIVCAMFLDYQTSDCGPYYELLVAPSAFAFASGTYPSITRIFVSTYDSVVNGRHNWGIPKDRADFERRHDDAHATDQVRVSHNGHTFAELELRAFGPSLPTSTWLIPKKRRTLLQLWQGKSYRTTLSAHGAVRLARVASWRFDPAYFPDLARGTVLGAAYFPRFEMTFPVAEVSEQAE